jgi:hypothetical protein
MLLTRSPDVGFGFVRARRVAHVLSWPKHLLCAAQADDAEPEFEV